MAKLEPGQQLVGRGPTAVTMERVNGDVWCMRGGFPHRTMNVYFIERPGGGVTLFEAGIRSMTRHVREVGQKLGGIDRVILSHGHADHRGTAPGLGVPVWCHEDEIVYAEADEPQPYKDFRPLPRWTKAGPVRAAYPWIMRMWDGGPVKIAGTLAEGDTVGEFEVIHFPGHAPGLIGLWRERDRLLLASDTFYTLEPTTGDFGHPRLPLDAFNQDTAQARASLMKAAALEPAVAWSGHADPLEGDVRAQLEAAP